MQKIKNTTLVRDLPGIPAGTKGKLWNAGNGEGYGFCFSAKHDDDKSYYFSSEHVEKYSDWFAVEWGQMNDEGFFVL